MASFDKTSKYALRVQTPNLYKGMPRYMNSKSKLPSFMQKNSGNRFTMKILNDKMLELNSFMDGKFQTIISGFNIHTNRKKKIEFEDDDFFQNNFVKTRPTTTKSVNKYKKPSRP